MIPMEKASPNVPVRNPVVPGFHPDPSVCRVGDDYYLANSSFEYFPGVPIFHSRDLVDWRQIGNVLDRPEQLALETAPSSGGIFAPTLRYHDGRFWMITTNLWGGGNFLVTAEDPAGPWSDPVSVDIPGIDPDIAWTDDGTCFVTWSDFGKISQTTIDASSGELTGPIRDLWSGTGLAHPEAPHLYAIDGRWYLLIAEGGTERGHAVSVAVADSPDGSFEGCPDNPILSHRSLGHPIKNTGHADLVQLPDGTWWMVLLGVRPRGSTPGFHVLGRETFLAPFEWDEAGWPVTQGVPEEVHELVPASVDPVSDPSRDDFDSAKLHPRWISVRRRRDSDYSLTARPGWLRLNGGSEGLDRELPTFVGRRQQHHGCHVTTRVESRAGEAGLAVRMDERHHAEVALVGERIVARARFGDLAAELGSVARPGEPVELGVTAVPDPASGGPDSLLFSVGSGDDRIELASVDGRYLSTEVVGGFTGRVIGVYACDGEADFDWFDYEGES